MKAREPWLTALRGVYDAAVELADYYEGRSCHITVRNVALAAREASRVLSSAEVAVPDDEYAHYVLDDEEDAIRCTVCGAENSHE